MSVADCARLRGFIFSRLLNIIIDTSYEIRHTVGNKIKRSNTVNAVIQIEFFNLNLCLAYIFVMLYSLK